MSSADGFEEEDAGPAAADDAAADAVEPFLLLLPPTCFFLPAAAALQQQPHKRSRTSNIRIPSTSPKVHHNQAVSKSQPLAAANLEQGTPGSCNSKFIKKHLMLQTAHAACML
jgi:hypothetical protein